MVNKSVDFRLKVVKDYLSNTHSLRKTAKNFNINYRTVFRWVSKFRKYGPQSLTTGYNRTNKTDPNTVRTIIELRERYPGIPLRKLRHILNERGIKISLGALWKILRNSGYAGFSKNRLSNDYTDYLSYPESFNESFSIIQFLLNEGRSIQAANYLNELEVFPKNKILENIPEGYLNLKRRIERHLAQFGRTQIEKYLDSSKNLFEECLRQKFYISAIRVGVAILVALSWVGDKTELFKWKERIEAIMNLGYSEKLSHLMFPIRFSLRIAEAFALVYANRIKDSLKIANKCNKMLLRLRILPPNLMSDLAMLYISLEQYQKAENLILKILPLVEQSKANRLKGYLAGFIYFPRGEFKKAIELLRTSEMYDWLRNSRWFRFRGNYYLMRGSPSMAIMMQQKALNAATKEGLPEEIIHSYLGLASAYAALNEENKANYLLKKLKLYIKKRNLQRFETLANILQNKKIESSDLLPLSSIRLVMLLKTKGYSYALQYARKNGIMLQFFRYLLFFPESLHRRIQKGKPIDLPMAFLKLPIFNSKSITIDIKFLGSLIISRNQISLKQKISPKIESLIIHIADRIPEPYLSVPIKTLCENFWPKSESASRNLSHLLTQIRRLLQIPTHFLEIDCKGTEPVLKNNNLYFTTDYQEFEQTLAQAKALERAGEWKFARKEYLRAFKLFRGEPFKKNFDNWSVDMRFKILSQFETEAINFAKSCIQHNKEIRHTKGRTPNEMADARKILQKVLKIIPDSEEARNLSDSLIVP